MKKLIITFIVLCALPAFMVNAEDTTELTTHSLQTEETTELYGLPEEVTEVTSEFVELETNVEGEIIEPTVSYRPQSLDELNAQLPDEIQVLENSEFPSESTTVEFTSEVTTEETTEETTELIYDELPLIESESTEPPVDTNSLDAEGDSVDMSYYNTGYFDYLVLGLSILGLIICGICIYILLKKKDE